MIDNIFEIRVVALGMAVDVCGKAARAGGNVDSSVIVEIAEDFEHYLTGADLVEAGAEIELFRRAYNLLSVAKFDEERSPYDAENHWRAECDNVMRLLRAAAGDENETEAEA